MAGRFDNSTAFGEPRLKCFSWGPSFERSLLKRTFIGDGPTAARPHDPVIERLKRRSA